MAVQASRAYDVDRRRILPQLRTTQRVLSTRWAPILQDWTKQRRENHCCACILHCTREYGKAPNGSNYFQIQTNIFHTLVTRENMEGSAICETVARIQVDTNRNVRMQ